MGIGKNWLSRLRAKKLRGLLLGISMLSLISAGIQPTAAQAQQLNVYCQVSQAEAVRKEELRKAAFEGNDSARQEYSTLVQQHADRLRNCRTQNWPSNQAVWVRLYPCDLQPGILEAVLDRMVNLGYNQVYVEAFYGGQVLLPQADNPTVWPSVVQSPGYERRDLLAESIEKGRQRGMQVYAWMFTLNFGYSYAQRPDRQQVLARNGRGMDTLTFARSGGTSNSDEIFIDPYNPQAQQDYQRMLQSVLRRRPDGVLFDYIRYPRGNGAGSVAARVDDLWIYGDASRNVLFQRALNQQGLELIQRYISRGHLVDSDLDQVGQLYPAEPEPLWQSKTPSAVNPLPPASVRRPALQSELWRFSVAHAVQGVIDFLNQVAQPVQQQGIPAGAVFFPNGNQTVGTGGFDSRLQYWDRFSPSLEWHPMAYGVCGNTGCILDEIRRVLDAAGSGGHQFVKPAIAGTWGRPTNNRPALETQMEAIRRVAPQIKTVSHFAYSWQDAEFDRVRKFCQLR
ncbi:family 10 glycosylhydrolase [Pseudanabaena sp. FACHB-2040]|uniref:family 10 glycosylhydrolase n=1 Tax=Pseudanabaena sp. FACHB-2040 TaxID=2692859 RepID=UPI0016854CDB|nr:family 10 glycosylhydrolase [Pseudanabaena sp. FACHB-2040]MBD2260019.1 family 10 glycosylhydrolase [Pseudanabaena sp. FACHB-2040]